MPKAGNRAPLSRPSHQRVPLVTVVIAAGVVALASGCPHDPSQRPPASHDDGLQVTGRLHDRQVSVSDGEPEVRYGDCDPRDGRDNDLCVSSFTIDGAPFGLVIENPAVLEPARRLPPVAGRAAGCNHCDRFRDGLVVEIRLGDERLPVTSGLVEVRAAGPRYAASFILRARGLVLTGRFDVRPSSAP